MMQIQNTLSVDSYEMLIAYSISSALSVFIYFEYVTVLTKL